MLGRNHATMGLLVAEGIALTTHLPLHGMIPMVVGVGAGSLWPDIDEHESKISFSLVPISTMVSAVMSRITGGHRRATHSPIGIGISTGLALLAAKYNPHISMLLCIAAVYILLRSVIPTLVRWLFVGGSLGILVVSIFAGLALFHSHDTTTLVWWFGLGSLVHLVGDVVTAGGIPVMWPFSTTKVALTHMKVGSPTERIIGLLMTATLLVSVYVTLHGVSIKAPSTTALVTQAHNMLAHHGNAVISNLMYRLHLVSTSLLHQIKKY